MKTIHVISGEESFVSYLPDSYNDDHIYVGQLQEDLSVKKIRYDDSGLRTAEGIPIYTRSES